MCVGEGKERVCDKMKDLLHTCRSKFHWTQFNKIRIWKDNVHLNNYILFLFLVLKHMNIQICVSYSYIS